VGRAKTRAFARRSAPDAVRPIIDEFDHRVRGLLAQLFETKG